MAFWLARRPPILACIFADASCSTAFATWALVGVSSVAFLAAYYAALKAAEAFSVSAKALEVSQNAYDLESRAILGLSLCDHDDDKKPRVAVYADDKDRVIRDFPPSGLSKDDYVRVDYDFVSLGRSPLEQVAVRLRIFPYNGDSYDELLAIGNITAEKDAHVSVYIRKSMQMSEIEWDPLADDARGDLPYTPEAKVGIRVSVDKRTKVSTYQPMRVRRVDKVSEAQKEPSDKNA